MRSDSAVVSPSVDLVYAAISISSGGIGTALQSGTLRKNKRCQRRYRLSSEAVAARSR